MKYSSGPARRAGLSSSRGVSLVPTGAGPHFSTGRQPGESWDRWRERMAKAAAELDAKLAADKADALARRGRRGAT